MRAIRGLAVSPLILLAMLLVCSLEAQPEGQSSRSRTLSEFEVKPSPDLLSHQQLEKFERLVDQTFSIEQLVQSLDSLLIIWKTSPPALSLPIVKMEVKFLPDSSNLGLIIYLEELEKRVVDTLAFSGPGARDRSELVRLIRTKEGDPFENTTWRNDLSEILNYFDEKGHAFARLQNIRIKPGAFDGNLAVSPSMTIIPGRVVSVERLEFSGLEKTKPSLARRILRLPGQFRWNPRLAEEAGKRLLRTGWFSEVRTPTLFQDNNGRYGLLYPVEESTTNTVSGAVGYAPDDEGTDGLAGSIDAELQNIFGTGRSASLHWQRDSETRSSFALSYKEPFLFNQPLHLKLELEQQVEESLFVAMSYGTALEWEFIPNWTVEGAVRSRRVTADSLAFGADSLSYNLFEYSLGVQLDTRDYPANPTSGGWYRAGTSTISPQSGDYSESIYRRWGHLQQSTRLSGPLAGYLSLNFEELSGADFIPRAEWIRLGGATTLRGFSESRYHARRAGWFSTELRSILNRDGRAYLFVDNAWLDTGESDSWKTGYGVGIQFGSHQGILNVAFGLPTTGGWTAAVVHAKAEARF